MAGKEQKAVDAQGNTYVVRGGKWVKESAAPGGAVKLTNPDKKVLNDLASAAKDATEVGIQYKRARSALNGVNPGPWRGAFLDAAIPEDNGGFMDRLGGWLIGGPARITGALTSKEVNDYQTARSIQSEAVQQKQTLQKGVQTEGDAARIMLSDISPSKSRAVNNEIMAAGEAKIRRAQARASFYTKWANTYGLNGLNPQGQSVEQVFNSRYGDGAGAGAGIKITKVK